MIFIIANGGSVSAKLEKNYSMLNNGVKFQSVQSKINSIPLNYNKKKLIFKEIKHK